MPRTVVFSGQFRQPSLQLNDSEPAVWNIELAEVRRYTARFTGVSEYRVLSNSCSGARTQKGAVMVNQRVVTFSGVIFLVALCASRTELPRTRVLEPSALFRARPTTDCRVSELVRAEPPRDPHADSFGLGPWYINADWSIWAGWNAETASRLAEILDSLSPEERAILVRRAVGFSNRELEEVYGRLVDVEELVLRVVERVRSCRGALQV